jgi:hypothetical protein
VVVTSLEYVVNDLRKKPKQTIIGVLTVFLTVSFITFLSGLSYIAPVIDMKSSVAGCGDFDIIIRKPRSSEVKIVGTTNYYNDPDHFFGSRFEPKM